MNWRSLLLPVAIGAVFIVVSIPSVSGALFTPNGKFWTGILSRNSADLNGYVGIVEEIRQGHYRARNLFTAESHPPFQIRPLFLIFGLMGRVLTSISTVTLIEFGRILASLCLIMIFCMFCRRLFRDPAEQSIALILVILGSGLGWMRLVADPPDLRIVEFSTFLTLLSPVLYSTSLSLILAILFCLDRAFSRKENAAKFSLLAGIFAMWLGFDRPFGLAPVVTAAAAVWIWNWIENRQFSRALLLIPLILGISIPVAYQLAAIREIPVYAAWNRQHTLSTPEWPRVLSSFGLMIPFAAIGLPRLFREHKNLAVLLCGYILGSTILSHLPLPFQERFIEGAPACIAILASYGFVYLLRTMKKSLLKTAVSTILVMGFLPSGFIAWTHDLETISRQSLPQYIPAKFVQGMRALIPLSQPDEAVLSTEASGNFIAAYAARPVVLGQKIQTVQYFEKWELVRKFFTSKPEDPLIPQLLKQSHAKWVFWGPEEAWLANGVFHPARCPWLQQEYDNGLIGLYRFTGE